MQDETQSKLTVQARILHRWEDLRLRWDGSNYDDIQMIHINTDDIWVPRLFINDSFHHYGLGECHPTECILKSSGQVGCWIPCLQTLDCDADYANWPYDSHVCKVAFKTFYNYEDVKFNSDAIGGQIVVNTSSEWKISSMTGLLDIKNKYSVKFLITIERYTGTLYKHITAPVYCLIAFTLAVLWMKSTNIWRLLFCGINLFLHFELMDRIWWQFPANGAAKNIPNILKSMTVMLIVSTLILIESILIKVISARCSDAPIWIRKVVSIVETNLVIKYAILSPTEMIEVDENGTAGELKKSSNTMESFCRLIDRALFVILLVFFLFFKIV